jgi:hypothetical protein
MRELLTIDISSLKQALEFHDQGWTPWKEECDLFIAAARQLLAAMQREERLLIALRNIIQELEYDPSNWSIIREDAIAALNQNEVSDVG